MCFATQVTQVKTGAGTKTLRDRCFGQRQYFTDAPQASALQSCDLFAWQRQQRQRQWFELLLKLSTGVGDSAEPGTRQQRGALRCERDA